MQRIDAPAVKALELRAPRASRYDAQEIQSQLQGGGILGTFSEEERRYIFERLCRFNTLIPSLYTFFRDLTYWEACIESVKHLVTVSRRDTIFSTFERRFTPINRQDNRVLIQVGESHFVPITGSSDVHVELGFRQIIVFAMRHFLEIPREPVSRDITVRPRVKADRFVLRQFAQLAIRLKFESPEIGQLSQISSPEESLEPLAVPNSNKPLLVTSGPGESRRRRCGLPTLDTFKDDREFLFIHHLYDDQDERGEGITSFFVLKAIYSAFMGPSDKLVSLWSQPLTDMALFRNVADGAEPSVSHD